MVFGSIGVELGVTTFRALFRGEIKNQTGDDPTTHLTNQIRSPHPAGKKLKGPQAQGNTLDPTWIQILPGFRTDLPKPI